MTREEAIKVLSTTEFMVLEGREKFEKALKLAIEALQERPKGRWIYENSLRMSRKCSVCEG